MQDLAGTTAAVTVVGGAHRLDQDSVQSKHVDVDGNLNRQGQV